MLSKKEYIESLMSDELIMSDLSHKLDTKGGTEKSKEWGIAPDVIRKVIIEKDVETISTRPYTEAIILEYGRPALLIRNDDFVIAESDEWNNRLRPTKLLIRNAIKASGRIELEGHPDFPWVGTGWQIAENVIVTNRHVAMEFGTRKGKGFVFKVNPERDIIKARVDYREEYRQSYSALEFGIEKILYISEFNDNTPDVAFLKLENSPRLPEPIPIKVKKSFKDDFVCVIGYPAKDGRRNDQNVMEKIFGDIYNVKRLQPGRIILYPNKKNEFIFHHDCSTLGGNSGSVVLDINTGEAIGLHFGGRFRQNNYAVKGETIINLLRKSKTSVSFAQSIENYNTFEESVSNISLRDQKLLGYNPDHLSKKLGVPLPNIDYFINNNDVLVVDGNSNSYELKYTHFSVALSKSRKMPIYSICNIDGENWYKIPRRNDKWYYDDRINKKDQLGNEIYKGNDLDRGHMTRREDPNWGTKDIAIQANEDTFHYTNACPQHKDLNQNKSTWQGLENYILDNAKSNDLKATIITGPIFSENDMYYRGTKIPGEFWKIVLIAMSKKKLSATAYLLSQKNLLDDLSEVSDFRYGQYKTFQVPIQTIEEKSRLTFGDLKDFDPLNVEEEGFNMHEIKEYYDIKL